MQVELTKQKEPLFFDSRGGWNKHKFNVDFFRSWSDDMAYLLGFLYADGSIIDASDSSRTQYIRFSNTDRGIIRKIKQVLGAGHPIRSQASRKAQHVNGKSYISKELFYLSIGSRRLFTDLSMLGLHPRKSKTMKFPEVPHDYLGHFTRGYFDGDGTISISRKKRSEKRTVFSRAATIFSSGSKIFLRALAIALVETIDVREAGLYDGNRCFQTWYFTKDTVKIFKFMYNDAKGLFIKRKFDIFEDFFQERTKWLDVDIDRILDENKKHLAWYPSR